jgi:hypothetical protein
MGPQRACARHAVPISLVLLETVLAQDFVESDCLLVDVIPVVGLFDHGEGCHDLQRNRVGEQFPGKRRSGAFALPQLFQRLARGGDQEVLAAADECRIESVFREG